MATPTQKATSAARKNEREKAEKNGRFFAGGAVVGVTASLAWGDQIPDLGPVDGTIAAGAVLFLAAGKKRSRNAALMRGVGVGMIAPAGIKVIKDQLVPMLGADRQLSNGTMDTRIQDVASGQSQVDYVPNPGAVSEGGT